MDTTLSDLEKKIDQLVTLVHQLRSENQLLRQQLAAKTDETKRLSEKIEVAKTRLNTLLKHLPEKENLKTGSRA